MPAEENIPFGPPRAAPRSPGNMAAKKNAPAQPLSASPSRLDSSTLPANFAHDLNNFISIINGYAEVGLAYLDDKHKDEKLLKYLTSIHNAGQQAADFTRQLLALSNQNKLSPPPLSFNGFPVGSESVLVIEDEVVLRELLHTVLGQHGYRITLASNGEQATKIFSSSPKSFDIVLLDLQLPDTSGLVILDRIRQISIQQKVIAVSGCINAESDAALTRLGVLDLLRKPYHLNELGRALRTALARAA